MLQTRSIPAVRSKIWALLLLLCPVGSALAWENGPGLGIKGGFQRLTSPLTHEKTNRGRLELEMCTPRLADGTVDLAATFGWSPLGSLSDSSSTVEDELLVDRWSEDRLHLFDVRLAARLYPLGRRHSTISPYVGAGIGYFWFLDLWEDNVLATDPVSGDSARDSASGTETVAQGLFPFVLGGLTVSLNGRAELLLEVQYDIEKRDNGYDVGGPSYMIGARIRW